MFLNEHPQPIQEIDGNNEKKCLCKKSNKNY